MLGKELSPELTREILRKIAHHEQRQDLGNIYFAVWQVLSKVPGLTVHKLEEILRENGSQVYLVATDAACAPPEMMVVHPVTDRLADYSFGICFGSQNFRMHLALEGITEEQNNERLYRAGILKRRKPIDNTLNLPQAELSHNISSN